MIQSYKNLRMQIIFIIQHIRRKVFLIAYIVIQYTIYGESRKLELIELAVKNIELQNHVIIP